MTTPPFRFRQQIIEEFAAKGSATLDVAPEHVSLARSTARAVGRQLGRPVQTVVSNAGPLAVTAILSDWPATVEEGIKREANKRAAVRAVARS